MQRRPDADSYQHLPDYTVEDALAKNPKNPSDNLYWLREFELAAISPDVFDITYYSIQPRFYESYLKKMPANTFSQSNPMPRDFGSSVQKPMNVMDQLVRAKIIDNFPKAYFTVTEWTHLLTSWAPNQTMNYAFPTERFGKCPIAPEANGVATDSNCIAGGRSGYSVKLVSRDYLLSSKFALGGDPNIKGAILNPPPEDF